MAATELAVQIWEILTRHVTAASARKKYLPLPAV
jgi:hypothetical protein